jgi:hypothetical protein
MGGKHGETKNGRIMQGQDQSGRIADGMNPPPPRLWRVNRMNRIKAKI